MNWADKLQARTEHYRSELLPLMEWQKNHGRDSIVEFSANDALDVQAAVHIVKTFFGASSIRAVTTACGAGVYRAVARIEASAITVVYSKLED